MSRNRVIARPYAKAIFELARSEKTFSLWSQMLSLAASASMDKSVQELIKNPKFTTSQVIALFVDIGKDLFTPQMHSLLWTLAKFKRLDGLPEIAALYEQLRAEAEHVVSVELVSAFPLEKNEQQRFVDVLKHRTNCDIALENIVDESILGGAILRAGDLVIDGSIRGRLAKLGEAVGILDSKREL